MLINSRENLGRVKKLAEEKLFSHLKFLHPMHHAQNTVKFTSFYKKIKQILIYQTYKNGYNTSFAIGVIYML